MTSNHERQPLLESSRGSSQHNLSRREESGMTSSEPRSSTASVGPHWTHWIKPASDDERISFQPQYSYHTVYGQAADETKSQHPTLEHVVVHQQSEGIWDVAGFIGEPNARGLDRYTTLYHILGWWGDSFSNDFVQTLQNEVKHHTYSKAKLEGIGPTGEYEACYPKGSMACSANMEVHGFISYRWQTGRMDLHVAFISTFAMPIVFLLCILFYPIVVIIMTFAVDKNIDMNDPSVGVLPLGYVFTLTGVGVQPQSGIMWFWFKIVGVAILLPLLLAGAQLLFFRRKFWLDRFCVNQADGQLMWLGVRRMPLYLASSENLYCFFDEKYISRLWCLLELALYCCVRPNPRITFISVSQEKAGVLCFLVIFFLGFIAASIKFCLYADGSREYDMNSAGQRGGVPSSSWRTAFSVLGLVSKILVQAIVYYCGRQLYRALDSLAQTEQDFDVRNCKLGSEDDRPVLLAQIQNLFATFPDALNRIQVGVSNRGSATEDSPPQSAREQETDGLEIFNKFIRRNLRQHLPWSGLKSCVILSYFPAFLVSSVIHNFIYGVIDNWHNESWFNMMDNFASGADFDTGSQPTSFTRELHFGTIFARCWGAFVAGPLDIWILGLYVKLLWMVERRWRIHCCILYIVLFLFDIFLPLRRWFSDSFVHGPQLNMIVFDKFSFHPSPFYFMPTILYYPLSGDSTYDGGLGLNVLSGGMDEKHNTVTVDLHPGWNVLIIIWTIFVTAFTYYVYESAFLRHYRLKGWDWICNLWAKKC